MRLVFQPSERVERPSDGKSWISKSGLVFLTPPLTATVFDKLFKLLLRPGQPVLTHNTLYVATQTMYEPRHSFSLQIFYLVHYFFI